MKNLLKPGGTVLITTRSKGFGYHGYPYDFWRYEKEDMRNIFSDFDIIDVRDDPVDKGVFVKAKKPANFNENDLSSQTLYSIVLCRRVRRLDGLVYFIVKPLLGLMSAIFRLLIPVSLKKRVLKTLYERH